MQTIYAIIPSIWAVSGLAHSSLLFRNSKSQSLSEGGYLRASQFSTAQYRHGYGPPFIPFVQAMVYSSSPRELHHDWLLTPGVCFSAFQL